MIQPSLPEILPWAMAAALSIAAYLLVGAFLDSIRLRSTAGRIDRFTGSDTEQEAETAVGSEQHKVRMAFGRLRLDVAGKEQIALWTARIGLTILLGIAVWQSGFPAATALAAPILAWIAISSFVENSWSQAKREIENELPTFLSRLAGTIQASPNVLLALGEVNQTLDNEGPLKEWMERLESRLQRGGKPAVDEMLAEADTLSPSLGLTVFEIGRLWEMGGKGFSDAFVRAAENLGEILDSRARADAKGAGMKSAVRIVLGTMVLVVVVMLRNPAVSASVRTPLVQLAYLGIVIWVGIGWLFINGMIEEAIG